MIKQSQPTLRQLLAKPVNGQLLIDKCSAWRKEVQQVKDYFSKISAIVELLSAEIVVYV
jgi:hypothetical protein